MLGGLEEAGVDLGAEGTGPRAHLLAVAAARLRLRVLFEFLEAQEEVLARVQVSQVELVFGDARVVGRNRGQECLDLLRLGVVRLLGARSPHGLVLGVQLGQVGGHWILRLALCLFGSGRLGLVRHRRG